jgi:hypothetical protein
MTHSEFVALVPSMDEDLKDEGLEDHDRIGTNSRPLSLQPFLLHRRQWHLLNGNAQSEHFATAVLPHGVPTSLSLDTYSIWQNGFMESPKNISVPMQSSKCEIG